MSEKAWPSIIIQYSLVYTFTILVFKNPGFDKDPQNIACISTTGHTVYIILSSPVTTILL
jgi:hypothetical protein